MTDYVVLVRSVNTCDYSSCSAAIINVYDFMDDFISVTRQLKKLRYQVTSYLQVLSAGPPKVSRSTGELDCIYDI